MKCPNCDKELKEDEELSTEDRKVFKVYLVGDNLERKCLSCARETKAEK